MTVPTFLLYLVTWLVVALSPGPAVMLSVAQATKHGFRASLSGIAGIQCGNLIFFVGAALGLGALLSSAAGAFTALRVVGAVYLFYLGARAVVLSFRRPETVVATAVVPATNRSLFLQGALVQLTNPKALLFVSALLPPIFRSCLLLEPAAHPFGGRNDRGRSGGTLFLRVRRTAGAAAISVVHDRNLSRARVWCSVDVFRGTPVARAEMKQRRTADARNPTGRRFGRTDR